MGGICARTINENLPNYELLCQNLEEKLLFPKKMRNFANDKYKRNI